MTILNLRISYILTLSWPLPTSHAQAITIEPLDVWRYFHCMLPYLWKMITFAWFIQIQNFPVAHCHVFRRINMVYLSLPFSSIIPRSQIESIESKPVTSVSHHLSLSRTIFVSIPPMFLTPLPGAKTRGQLTPVCYNRKRCEDTFRRTVKCTINSDILQSVFINWRYPRPWQHSERISEYLTFCSIHPSRFIFL